MSAACGSANPVAALADVRLYSVSQGSDSDIPDVIAATSQQHVIDLVFYTMASSQKDGLFARSERPGLSKIR